MRILIIIFVSSTIFSCTHEAEINKDLLLGEWSRTKTIDSLFSTFPPPPFGTPHFGVAFNQNKIDLYRGFRRVNRDSITGKRSIEYAGSLTDYKINADSIFILEPFEKKWIFKWKIIHLTEDSLTLTQNDSTFTILIKRETEKNSDFDQIILSSTGCYGSCPIIDVSINKENQVYFQGEGFVNPIGFYEAELDSSLTARVFSKFERLILDSIKENYSANYTDGEAITTTFIKNGKIVRTVNDYGLMGPKELLWGYVALKGLHQNINLESLKYDDPFYPKLHYYVFNNKSTELRLKKSESFFLWTEIKEANLSEEEFTSKYNVWFRRNYTYWGPDPNPSLEHKYSMKKIESDGRFFKFIFEKQQSITYDLGYNFIERNFTLNDFTSKEK